MLNQTERLTDEERLLIIIKQVTKTWAAKGFLWDLSQTELGNTCSIHFVLDAASSVRLVSIMFETN